MSATCWPLWKKQRIQSAAPSQAEIGRSGVFATGTLVLVTQSTASMPAPWWGGRGRGRNYADFDSALHL